MASGFALSTEEMRANLGKLVERVDVFGGQLVEALKRRNAQMEEAETTSLQNRLDMNSKAFQRIKEGLQTHLETYKENLAKQREALREDYDRKLETYEKDAASRIGLVRAQSITEIKGIKERITALQRETEAEDDAQRERENNIKRQAISNQWLAAGLRNDKEGMKKALNDLEEFERDLFKNRVRRDRQGEIERFNAAIEGIRERHEEAEKGLIRELEQKKRAAADELKEKILQTEETLKEEEKLAAGTLAIFERITREHGEELEKQLAATKTHFKTLNEEEALQAEARKLAITESNDAIILLLNTYNPQWQDAGRSWGAKLVEGLESERANVQAAVNSMLALIGQAKAAAASLIPPTSEAELMPPGIPKEIPGRELIPAGIPSGPRVTIGPREFQRGGLVLQPTLALLGEKGPEAVVPLRGAGSLGTPMINITIINRGIIGVDDLNMHIFQAIRDGKRRGAFEGVIA